MLNISVEERQSILDVSEKILKEGVK